MDNLEEMLIRGFPVSDGIAIGIPFFLNPVQEDIPEFSITMKEVDSEIARYRSALFSSREDLQQLRKNLAEEVSEDAATIIETHIQMLDDPLMTQHMEDKIRQTLTNSESVFQSVITDYEKRFSRKTDSFFQERLVDVMDLANRVLGHLCPTKGNSLLNVPFNSIVFAKELIPSHTASAESSRVSAFVTQSGGGNSHAALIARAKGIPYVACVDVNAVQDLPARCVIVDGQSGDVVFNPKPATLEKYKQRKTRLKTSFQLLQKEMQYDSETVDGCCIQVFANIGNLGDLDNIQQYGPEGVGLFRTEYLFFQHRQLITCEEEQYNAYLKLIQTVGNMPVVIRVFDVGGDKNPELFSEGEREPNPVLGCRGIRFLLRHPEIFKIQLRAILRAAVHGDVRILLPLISDISELESSRALIAEISKSLQAEGIPFKASVPVGCMIEVPSAVLICDALAEKSDFLSIGTNDLVQYTLGIDRSNPAMSDFCYPAHPSVLRMIKMVNTEAKRHGRTVTICGEIASNPLFVPLLLGLGVDQLSCSPRYIPIVKRAIRQTSLLAAYELAQRVLRLNSTMEVSQVLLEAYNNASTST
ncbi:MAG: phosphoenolpyruvate--protein phosphotransferase [Verrucomicrobia bacterium]|nr:phosphoenolpyruvate--protein phosphotransferase [Verrucomicrobiota bacterium]